MATPEHLFAAPITDDPWHLHLHAIGLSTVLWNRMEEYLNHYVLSLAHIHHRSPIAPVLEKAGNVSKADLLTRLAAHNKWESDGIDALDHFVRAFNICRENRNIVMHSRYEDDEERGGLHMTKLSNTGATLTFSSSVEELRQVATEMADTLDYFVRVMEVGRVRDPEFGQLLWTMTRPHGTQLPTWPEIPPLPRKLNPLPTTQQGV